VYDVNDFDPAEFLPNTQTHRYATMATMPIMIAHDQEPLKYNLYDWPTLKTFVQHRIATEPLFSHPDLDDATRTQIAAKLIKMHLRAAVTLPFNIYDKTLLCHSELHSAELEKYQAHGFIGVYWWSHALIARDWYRYAEHDQKLQYSTQCFAHDFLIYNRAWSGTREYRIKFAELLVRKDLIQSCWVKFNAQDQAQHYQTYQFTNNQFATELDLEKHFEPNQAASFHSADYVSNDYADCAVEVVLETLFDDSRIHLTEKTLRPIACGKPFLLGATPGSLKYLHRYGFRTFAPWIDESYDEIIDPVARLQAITDEMKKIATLTSTEKTQLFTQLQTIADFNRQRFFSAEFAQTIITEFQTNLQSALKELKQYRTGSHYLWFMPINIKHGHRFFRPPEVEYIKAELERKQ